MRVSFDMLTHALSLSKGTNAAFLVASGDYPTCLRQASLLNPGLRRMVLTYPETGPCMLFLFTGAAEATAKAHRPIALHAGFLRTVPHGSALAVG